MFKNLFNGMSYLLKSFPSVFTSDIEIHSFENDSITLKKDWEKIGNDMRRAVNEFKTSEKYTSKK